MFSIGDNSISSYKVHGSGNDFVENLYGHEILIWYCRLQWKIDNILIFWLYVKLIVVWNMKPKLFSLFFVIFGSCS
jgi:hypothetical protein